MCRTLRTLHTLPVFAALLFATAAHSHSFDLGNLRIGNPFARPTVAQQPAGAAYLSIENRGKTTDTLVRASSPVAREVQIHTMSMEGDIMRMREVLRLDLKPESTVTMTPGKGYHIMLIGLKQPLKAGEQFPMTLIFEKSGQVEVSVTVEARNQGASAPMSDKNHGHKH
ncbi:copper chaperone PCu(A)C [Lacisediminimonas sp.]|uniref:copper chaperone PCu(A)C n=1 Tax=Lacisediminimonas sp. TaxID=3060582 RepID=UPI002728E68F|nr:copper chaperone PCu(A)C [Lacisediminimonas sp.]MDO8300516.1 copper chaperone PCu(A)C [Lacisediminimonas sp.]